MSEMCKLVPTVKKRNGVKMEEKESQLFKDIKSAVQDYEMSWKLWAFSKTSYFKDRYGKMVNYDEFGEVTFPSLIEALDLKESYDSQKKIKDVMRDYGFDKDTFEDANVAVDKINRFNSTEKKFIALVRKEDDHYKIIVKDRSSITREEAEQQSYNHALTGEILRFMNALGFNIDWVNDSKYDGLFDPENTTMQDGLITLIKIAKGERGEQALPEEFAHMIIEGLRNHPLVQRLLASFTSDDVKEILGDSYDNYSEKYQNDRGRLVTEAAGKLLGDYISEKGTINQEKVIEKKSLLSRIWNWVKNLFSKVRNNDVDNLKNRARREIAPIYELISSGEAIKSIDRENILNAKSLYRLSAEVSNNLENLALAAEKTQAQLYTEERRKGKIASANATLGALAGMRNAYSREEGLETDDAFGSVLIFLDDALRHFKEIQSMQAAAQKLEETGDLSDIRVLNSIAEAVREINLMNDGYQDYFEAIRGIQSDSNLAKYGITEPQAKQLAETADECTKILRVANTWKHATTINIITKMAKTVITTDKVRGIGSRREEIMAVEQIVDHASRDINFIDRYLSAMSDADDTMLTVFDSIVKNQQDERDFEMIEWQAKISKIDRELRAAGFTSDFMYERDDKGVPTNRIISVYDWETFSKERYALQDALRERVSNGEITKEQMNEEITSWERAEIKGHPRMVPVYVDPKIQAYYEEHGKAATENHFKDDPRLGLVERAPNPKVYTRYANRIESLKDAQKKYYYAMMDIKRTMMTKIPRRGQRIYRTINISKDLVEGILQNSTGNPIKATLDYYKRKFIRRPDDIGFGMKENTEEDIQNIIAQGNNEYEKIADEIIDYISTSLDEDISVVLSRNNIIRILKTNKTSPHKAAQAVAEALTASSFVTVDIDFAGTRVQSLPIYYTRPLRDKRLLSTDFSSCLVAYSAMAVNYEKMNEVIDILEVGRSYMKERKVLETEGDKSVRAKFSALGKAYTSLVSRAGIDSSIAGRMDDFMSSVVYEERKADEGTYEILGVKLDTAKTLDAFKDYTGLLMLGFNIFSTISNIGMGKLQQWIEAYAGEYFNIKHYGKAVATYHKEMFSGCFLEMNSPIKKNKLSLLIQLFNPMGEYFDSLKSTHYHKNAVARILGNGMLGYVGMNAGEHLLRCQTMLAMLYATELVDEKGNKTNLYDALEVKEVDGIYKLVLKEGLSYERELIDQTGTTYKDPATGKIKSNNPNYGKALRDENGKIKTELVKLSDLNDANTRKFISKRRRAMRKVNDSLNGAFSPNEKGAAHRKALMRLILQFRQWMPAHYMRRFARAHYDSDLEQWREGYYITVVKALNSMRKELKKAGIKSLLMYKNLSNHERANLRRANAEIAQFWLLALLIRMGGRVKDRDRSWLDKMFLYQLHRMKLEVGSSMPIMNGSFFSNIFQVLRSPAASITSFERISKLIQFWRMFDEIESGRYEGWTEFQKYAYESFPAVFQISKAIIFDDSMFSQFEKDD